MITSATTASGTVGSAFSYQITATNTPTSYGATGLPAGLIGEQRDRIDLGDADGGRNIDGDAERDQQRGNRQRHSDADHRNPAAPVITSATTASGTVGSAFSYQITATQHADQLRGDGFAGGFIGEQRHRVDLGDADGGGNVDGDAERDQQRGNRHRHPDADHHRGGAGDHQRDHGERDGGKRILVSDHGHATRRPVTGRRDCRRA